MTVIILIFILGMSDDSELAFVCLSFVRPDMVRIRDHNSYFLLALFLASKLLGRTFFLTRRTTMTLFIFNLKCVKMHTELSFAVITKYQNYKIINMTKDNISKYL